TASNCFACHQNNDSHNGTLGQDCAACHSTQTWAGGRFDHNLAIFKLTGAHVNVLCVKCHTTNVFKGTASTCFACHQQNDSHKGTLGQDCAACHSTQTWAGATFDHNLAAFKLTGTHTTVLCAKCHINNVFKGTPQICSSCHSDPAFHLGLFKGQVCSTCHTTIKWSPATFTLAHPQPIDGGDGGNGVRHGGAACRDCHTVNLMTATCTKCHRNNNPG
ncbi:MAG: hypothetical protein NTW32_02560, partial [Chloroflexi bacterium]|nr:hypothetical protein [Chloroflexota bacterium]